jgi:lipoyl synthase
VTHRSTEPCSRADLSRPHDGQGSIFDQAWQLSRSRHGNRLSVHVPGMFVVNGKRGRYRAVSITGDTCELDCEHCKGSLLKSMSHAGTPDSLMRIGMEAKARGDHGLLITGGCDSSGSLPWHDYLPTMKELKARTGLILTVHAGQTDLQTAQALKAAGVDQALVDVLGDDETAKEVYHLCDGVDTIRRTMASLAEADLEIIPHIVFGIYYGKKKGEEAALEMLSEFPLRKYIVVVLMPTRGTPMADVPPPSPESVALFIAKARLGLPHLEAGLGCARPRGSYSRGLDVLAIEAGINSLALPSDRALDVAQSRGLEIVYEETCCSLG